MNLGLVLDFLDKVEVDSLFLIVGVFPKILPPGTGFLNLDRDHGFCPVGEPKGCFHG